MQTLIVATAAAPAQENDDKDPGASPRRRPCQFDQCMSLPSRQAIPRRLAAHRPHQLEAHRLQHQQEPEEDASTPARRAPGMPTTRRSDPDGTLRVTPSARLPVASSSRPDVCAASMGSRRVAKPHTARGHASHRLSVEKLTDVRRHDAPEQEARARSFSADIAHGPRRAGSRANIRAADHQSRPEARRTTRETPSVPVHQSHRGRGQTRRPRVARLTRGRSFRQLPGVPAARALPQWRRAPSTRSDPWPRPNHPRPSTWVSSSSPRRKRARTRR